ncbi:MAG: ComEA family DNA-binding protein [Thermomicrobium sp.]|nr:ComEA family DNA-binding protein [Thermomicrobium sp.]MDW8059223.1 ComEA family DNA-binding protein [Thermomicrobium sp.]
MPRQWLTARWSFLLGIVLGAAVGVGLGTVWSQGDDLVLRVEPLATPSVVVVYVTGAVRHPGLYEVPNGARVGQVVEQASPAQDADLGRVPMAEPVRDGQTIAVPTVRSVGEATPERSTGGDRAATPVRDGERIDLNRATAEELEGLPGVGPALARRIVEYRAQHGPFRSVEELVNVAGISERMVADWGDLVTVGTVE